MSSPPFFVAGGLFFLCVFPFFSLFAHFSLLFLFLFGRFQRKEKKMVITFPSLPFGLPPPLFPHPFYKDCPPIHDTMTTVQKPLRNFRPYGADREILDERVKQSRPLLKIHYTRPRQYFIDRYHEVKLSTTDAMEHTHEYRPFKDPSYERLGVDKGVGCEHDIAFQAVCEVKDQKVQTPWFRKVSTAIQVQTQVVDARVTEVEAAEEPKIAGFLKNVIPRIEHNCVCNNVLQLFRDDYTQLMDDDTFLGNKDDAVFTDAGNFQHHKFTKNKTVTSIDWRPGSSRIVCISVGEAFSGSEDGSGYMQRVMLNRKVLTSLVVIWDFTDPIHPRWVLESPQVCFLFTFNFL